MPRDHPRLQRERRRRERRHSRAITRRSRSCFVCRCRAHVASPPPGEPLVDTVQRAARRTGRCSATGRCTSTSRARLFSVAARRGCASSPTCCRCPPSGRSGRPARRSATRPPTAMIRTGVPPAPRRGRAPARRRRRPAPGPGRRRSRLDHHARLADQPRGAVVEQRVGARDRIVGDTSAGRSAPRPRSTPRTTTNCADHRRVRQHQRRRTPVIAAASARKIRKTPGHDQLGDAERQRGDQPPPCRRRCRTSAHSSAARTAPRLRPAAALRAVDRACRAPPAPARRSRPACRSAASPRPGTGSSWHWARSRTCRSPRHISAR